MIKRFLVLCGFLSLLTCCKKSNSSSSIIPQVQEIETYSSYFDISSFEIYADSICLKSAELLILELNKLDYAVDSARLFKDPISTQSINLIVDTSLSLNPEYYELKISKDYILIKGTTYKGVLHGIYSLLQLLPGSLGVKDSKIPCLTINDYPKFKWRGFLLDCSRNFMKVDFIKRYIDLLAYHKMNILHWHLTDDQGWRIQIKQYPELTNIGAWRKQKDGSIYGGFYTQEQIKEVVEYALFRGVTVVPEIELPGHSLAALAAYPNYSCTGGPFEVENDWGVFKEIYCAGNDSTFIFLENILDEVIDLFPSKYIHIGGDEAPKYRWENCSKCQKRINDEELLDEHQLQAYFIKRISNYLQSKGKNLIGWDEILDGGLAEGATVQSWRSFDGAIEAAKLGHDAIVSPTSHAYFDYDLSAIDLQKVYNFNPIPDTLNADEKKYIIGGECNMWTERVPQNTVDSKVFPRILAMAEILWKYPKNKNYDNFYNRVQEHYKRLDELGVNYGLETLPIAFDSKYMKDSFHVSLTPGNNNLEVFYKLDNYNSITYDSTFSLKGNHTIKAWSEKNSKIYGDTIEFDLYAHKGLNAQLSGLHNYDASYAGGGDNSIKDGVRGSQNFRDGRWQGYFGQDFSATYKFSQEQSIDTVICSFYQYNLSWIFIPKKIIVYTSLDGTNYFNKAEYFPNVNPKKEGSFYREFVIDFNEVKANYIKVKAMSIGKCPEWHPASGADSWLFIDEIRIH